MTTWQELDFVQAPEESSVNVKEAETPAVAARGPCTGWEEVVFQLADDEALD